MAKIGIAGGLVRDSANQSKSDSDYLNQIDNFWNESSGSPVNKLETFTNYVSRQSLTKFIARYEIFKQIIGIHGSIVEVGVYKGASLMTWAHLSSILEPINYLRKIIGFDTFSGFTGVNSKDASGNCEHLKKSGFDSGSEAERDLTNAISLYDANRFMSHIEKIELIKGDVEHTLPDYIEKNQHLVVSLLHLDADLYMPTKITLETLLPRMPKGAIILFDELNLPAFPGETLALMDSLTIPNVKLQRFNFATSISYAVL